MKQGAKKLKAYQEKEGKPEKEGSAPSAPNAHDAEAKGRIKARDAAIRERLISAMLIEPEVLDMVFVHRAVFQAFFERYAPSGHMQYTELWQFCADFHLVPQLVSEQQLRKAYNAAECFGVLPPHCSRELSKQPPKARKAGQNTAARSRRGTSNPPSGVSGPSLSAPSAASSASPAVSRMSMMSLSGTGWDRGVHPHFCDTTESPPLYGGVSLWEALSVVSQNWSFPPALRHIRGAEEREPLRGAEEGLHRLQLHGGLRGEATIKTWVDEG